jgi:hypothetical protein
MEEGCGMDPGPDCLNEDSDCMDEGCMESVFLPSEKKESKQFVGIL